MQDAANVLAARANKEDLTRIRKALDDGDVVPSTEIIAFLGRRGSEFDVPRLSMKLSPRAHGLLATNSKELARQSARVAIKLVGSNLRRLLSSTSPAWFKIAVVQEASDKAFALVPLSDIDALLADGDEAIRAIVAKKMIRAWKGPQAKNFFARYMLRDQRFYNIIFWLDLIDSYPRDLARAVARRAMATG